MTLPIGVHILAHDLRERYEVSDPSAPMVRVMEISQEVVFTREVFIRVV